jgi:hypothetical protein
MHAPIAILVLSAGALLAGCVSPAADAPNPFPDAGSPYATRKITPTTVGQPSGVQWLADIRPNLGDVIDLVSATPEGSLGGATVQLWLSPQILRGSTFYCGEQLDDIAGAQLHARYASPGPDNDFCIVGQITASTPGVYTLSNIRVQYRLNGGDVRTGETGGTVWVVCVDTPSPACPTPPGD